MSEESKTQNISEAETSTENQPVETASPENENKIEMPTEVISETEEKIEIEPEIEPEIQQPTQEITPPPAETPKEETKTTPKPQIKTIEKIIYKFDPNIIQKLLNKARAKIQERKRKKLDKIMTLLETKSQVTNKDIQKLLRTTKRSSTRYFDLLEQEQKITQVGKTGKAVFYTKK